MKLIGPPAMSRKAARSVQSVPSQLQWGFVLAIGRAKTLDDLSPTYRDWFLNGYKETKSDKVTHNSLEEALSKVEIEWVEND
jgi:hypothetical protein